MSQMSLAAWSCRWLLILSPSFGMIRGEGTGFPVLFSILSQAYLWSHFWRGDIANKWSVPSLKNDSPMTLTSKPESVRARLLWETLQSKDGPFKKTLNVAVMLASLAAIFDHLLDVMGWIVSPLNSCVQVLPLPLRHDFIWNVIL